MREAFLTFVGIYLLSMFKFVAGPILGAAAGYSPWQIILVSLLGMMSSVTLFTFLGTRIGGTLILVSFGSAKKKIFSYMLLSGLAWATFFSFSIDWLLSIPVVAALFG
ncbi:MAG: hypothetical protein LW824_03735 [Algoriphagus sp.]|nr:hypothetical protein [Algoriphagus sp.]